MPAGLTDPSEELVINNISFPNEGIIEINYSEKRKHSEFAGIVETIYVDIEACKASRQVTEMLDLARELIDVGQLAIRNPPLKFSPRGRTVGGRREDEAGVDDDVDG